MAYEDKVLGHADEADGIEEYDNKLPAWWLGIFYFTIAYGIVYASVYHVASPTSQAAQYEDELAEAEELWPAPDAAEVAAAAQGPEAVAAGAEIFAANCVACHKEDLTGGIGPNLIDGEWIHGGEFDQIVNTITVGVPEKGMLSWGPILGPEKIAQVTAFIQSKGDGS
jgi:cytochrome c oxidase cbb3-type subunit 3